MFGIQTAAVYAGGESTTAAVANAEEYNGSSWTAATAIPAVKQTQTGFGTLTAGIVAGGNGNATTVLAYDGTSWTALPALGTGRGNLGGAGTSLAGLAVGGNSPGLGPARVHS